MSSSSEYVVRTLSVTREDGLHARPLILLVDHVALYGADVSISLIGKDPPYCSANASNILEVMCLDASKGSQLEFKIKSCTDIDSFMHGLAEILSNPRLL